MRCSVHCPPQSAVVPVAAVAAAAVPAAVAVESALVWLLVILAVACAAGTAVLVAVLRAGGRMWHPAAQVQAPARVAVEAATAPRAIEARHVVPAVVISEREEVRRDR